MAGVKPTEQEKDQIRDLVKQGYTVAEIQQRFPHTDGRTIAGIHVRIKSSVPAGTAPGGIVGSLPSDPKPENHPKPGDAGVKTPQQDAAEKTGFTPQSQTIHNPQGLLPSYREYFVIKKLDGADSGIIRTEQPPFGIVELYERYQPGDYELQHYRDGRLFATYRERIAPKAGAISGTIQPESKRQETPADFFLKAMDVYHKLRGEQKTEETVAKREEIALAAEKERTKAQVETAATVGLIELVKETSKPKPDPNAPAVDRLFTMMQESQKGSESRHKNEIELVREKAKADLELERERIKADAEARRQDALDRERQQQTFLSKMQELDQSRQTLWKESYDRMITSIKEMQDSMVDEFEKKKEWLDSYAKIQKDHTDEIIKLKREMGTGASDIKMAEIVKDGIVGAVDRIGHRVDTLVNAGVIGKNQGTVKQGIPPPASGANAAPPTSEPTKTGGTEMPSQDALKAASKEPWFQDLQDEIARTVKRRKNGMVLHGSMLGQAFLDKMNADAKHRVYFHYLCSRDWKEVLVDAQEGLKPEHKELFNDAECAKWFGEFQEFLIGSWNASVGIRS